MSTRSRLADGERWIERADPVVWAEPGDAGAEDVLTADELSAYERDGFLVRRDVFDPAEVKAMVDALEHLRETAADTAAQDAVCEPGSRALRTLFNLEEHSQIFDKLSRSRQIAGAARQILADDVYIHQSRLNYKPGFTGKEFYWHSDFETWHAEDGMPRMRALSASILLTDNSALNGPLMLMPGLAQALRRLRGRDAGRQPRDLAAEAGGGAPARRRAWRRWPSAAASTTAAGPAGTVIFFDCNTMHASNGNVTPFPRSNAFFVFNAVSNALTDPFAADEPRPSFLARRGTPRGVKLHTDPIG